MKPSLYAKTMLRESRGGRWRLLFFTACLAVGVSAVVSVAGLASSLDGGVRREARQLLAADIVVSGSRPIPPEVTALIDGDDSLRRVEIRELVTLVAAPVADDAPPGPSQLVELKVVEGAYPFYGRPELVPERPLSNLLATGAVAAPELLQRLGLKTGDDIAVGGQRIPIAGEVRTEPDRLAGSMGFAAGPRLFVSATDFEATDLEQLGSRIQYRTLIAFAADSQAAAVDPETWVERIEATLPEAGIYDVETYRNALPSLRRGLRRVERFLGLIALLSLLLGGIGVAQTVRAWLAGRIDAIAVLGCLGMRPREVLALYLGQTVILGLIGSGLGLALGVGLQWLIPALFPDLIPARLIDLWQPGALVRGLALGLGVAVLFAIPALTEVLRVPPARVLRHDAEPLPASRWSRWSIGLVLVVGIWVMAIVQSGSWVLGSGFTLALLFAGLLLAASSVGLTRLVARFPRDRFGRSSSRVARRTLLLFRHGLAALARPGAATLSAIVALGMGVLVVLGMWLVERQLTTELEADLPVDAPSVFLVDVQPDQWPAVEEILQESGADRIDSVPVVMARLSAIDDERASSLAESESEERDPTRQTVPTRQEENRRWALTREQRLTYLESLPDDNEIVAGQLWQEANVDEVSLEIEYAENLGVGLGSVLSFDVQGVPIDLVVTSLRRVDWSSFGINFFLVVEPGVLDEAPQNLLAAARLPVGAEPSLQDRLAAEIPNITLVRLREIMTKIVSILGRVALGIRSLGAFTVLAGIAILAGAVSAGSARRGREVALLKTLGMSRRGVVASFSVEYALIGAVAGIIGTVGGTVLAWAVLTRGMEIAWTMEWLPLIVSVAASMVLSIGAGLAASVGALRRRPIDVLRTADS